MPTKISGWQANDGKIFEHEHEAVEHERRNEVADKVRAKLINFQCIYEKDDDFEMLVEWIVAIHK